MRRMTTQILIKLNQQLAFSPQSSPPNDLFNMILLYFNQWLTAVSNYFHPLQWLEDANPFVLVALGIILLCVICCCCLPAIIRCITWLVILCWNLICGLFRVLWAMPRNLFSCLCGCGRRSVKMMKAPGRVGMLMGRSVFEGSPRNYFINLRAGRPI